MSPASYNDEKFWLRLSLLVSALLGVFAWINFTHLQEGTVGPEFQVYRTATRELVLTSNSPYSDQVALQNQLTIYGRHARPEEHELYLMLPIYSIAIIAPFAVIPDYHLARPLWMTMLQASLIALTVIALQVTAWRPGVWLMALLLFFSLSWYHAMSAVIDGNLVIVVALLVGTVFLAIKSGKDELAGILLALTTLKPQIVILLVVFIFIWVISHRRWAVIFWFLVGMAFLFFGGAVLVSDWPIQYINTILRYLEYRLLVTPGDIFIHWWPGIGASLGWGFTALMAILLLVEWRAARGKGFRWFLWTACLTIVVSQWIGIPTGPGNFIVMFLPLILVLAIWEERWRWRGKLIISLLLLIAFFGLWGLFLTTSELHIENKQHPIMFFALPGMLLIGLYWVRWSAIKSELLIESFKRTENNL